MAGQLRPRARDARWTGDGARGPLVVRPFAALPAATHHAPHRGATAVSAVIAGVAPGTQRLPRIDAGGVAVVPREAETPRPDQFGVGDRDGGGRAGSGPRRLTAVPHGATGGA